VPSDESLIARFVHSAVEPTGTFSCSSPLINQVHRNVIWGQLGNLVGIPTDCPQREERQGWLGDIQLAVEEAIYNFNMAAFLEKYLRDIKTSQHEDGGLSSVIPEYWNIYPADPAWGTAYMTLAWAVYWYYGDVQVLIDHYESLRRYVDYLDSVAEEGIIGNFSKLLFGDWCPPGSILPKRTPIELTSTWYYYSDTLVFSRIAGILGHDDQRKKYADRADVIKAAFSDRFLGEQGYEVIKMGPWDIFPGQTSNLLPIYLNMVPDDRRGQVLSRLLESVHEHHDRHLDTGIIGTRFLFDVLTDNGYGETAYRIATQDSYPGWGYMLKEGATTLWERWEKLQGSGMNSQNHIMLGSIDAWFYRAIAGIRPTEAGWKRVEIRPRPLGDLKYAAGSVETVLGRVRVSWERDGGSFRCRVSIPPGAKADVYLPVPDGQYTVTEGNAPIRGPARTAGDYVFEVKGTEAG